MENDDRLERRIEVLILSHELLAGDLKSLNALVTDIAVGTTRLQCAVESHEQRMI
jgi:hypothetical protein